MRKKSRKTFCTRHSNQGLFQGLKRVLNFKCNMKNVWKFTILTIFFSLQRNQCNLNENPSLPFKKSPCVLFSDLIFVHLNFPSLALWKENKRKYHFAVITLIFNDPFLQKSLHLHRLSPSMIFNFVMIRFGASYVNGNFSRDFLSPHTYLDSRLTLTLTPF